MESRPGFGRAKAYYIENVCRPAALLDFEETLALTLAVASSNDKLSLSAWEKLHYVVFNGRERHVKSDLPAKLSSSQGESIPIQELVSICHCLLNQKTLRILYQGLSDAEPRWRVLEPLQQFFQDRWYLLAFEPETSKQKTFRLDRIQSLETTDIRFAARPVDNPHFHRWDLSEDDPTTVVCRLDEAVCRWLRENPCHPTQVLSQQPRGVIMTVAVRDVANFLRWAASLSYCEILEPSSVRAMMKERLATQLQHYL